MRVADCRRLVPDRLAEPKSREDTHLIAGGRKRAGHRAIIEGVPRKDPGFLREVVVHSSGEKVLSRYLLDACAIDADVIITRNRLGRQRCQIEEGFQARICLGPEGRCWYV